MMSTVKLRALEPEDLDLIHTIENDATLWAWSSTTVPVSRYAVRLYLESQQNDIHVDGQLRLVIMLDGKSVGVLDLTDFQPRHYRAEVGIVLLPQYRSLGIGAEALRLLAVYAEEVLHLRSLHAYVGEENTSAVALFEAQGYVQVGRLLRWQDGERNVFIFQLLLK